MSRAADDTRVACKGYPRGTLLTLQRLGVNLVGMRVYVAGYPGFTWVDRFVGMVGRIKLVHEYEFEQNAQITANRPHSATADLQQPRQAYINVLVRWVDQTRWLDDREHEFALEVLELAAAQ